MVNSSLVRTVGPASYCLTLSQLKKHLRMEQDFTDEDDDLTDYIKTATEYFESLTAGRIILPTTFEESFPCWSKYLKLGVANVSSITSVTYLDTDGEEQEVEEWREDSSACPAILWIPGFSYPALDPEYPRPIKVTYVAGWANAGAVPPTVRTGIKLYCEHLYEDSRKVLGETVGELAPITHGFAALCSQWHTGLGGYFA